MGIGWDIIGGIIAMVLGEILYNLQRSCLCYCFVIERIKIDEMTLLLSPSSTPCGTKRYSFGFISSWRCSFLTRAVFAKCCRIFQSDGVALSAAGSKPLLWCLISCRCCFWRSPTWAWCNHLIFCFRWWAATTWGDVFFFFLMASEA